MLFDRRCFTESAEKKARQIGWLTIIETTKYKSAYFELYFLNLIGSQCYDFIRGIERIKRRAFITTLAKQF